LLLLLYRLHDLLWVVCEQPVKLLT
jgi:hypothetical protein